VVIYNAEFDTRLLDQTCQRYGLDVLTDGGIKFECAMLWYAQFVGDWSDYHGGYRWQPLGGGHRALGDCQATLGVIREMMRVN
jgi:DNA polymerase-3 subunit epsilon